MRLYTFMNFMLSPIQQGIQTAHILGEIYNSVVNLHQEDHKKEMFDEFNEYHKTIIVCNGGNATSIREYISLFSDKRNIHPWAFFNEDEDSLDRALTGVGIIIPKCLHDAKFEVIDGTPSYVYISEELDLVYVYNEDDYEFKLIDKIKKAPLAR